MLSATTHEFKSRILRPRDHYDLRTDLTRKPLAHDASRDWVVIVIRLRHDGDDIYLVAEAQNSELLGEAGPVDYTFELDQVVNVPALELRQVLQDLQATMQLADSKAASLMVVTEQIDLHLLSEAEKAHAVLDRSHMGITGFEFYIRSGTTLTMSIYVQYPVTMEQREVADRVEPYLAARGSAILDFTAYPYDNADGGILVDVSVPIDLRVGDCVALGHTVARILRFNTWDPRTLDGAHALLLTGHPDVLIGQPESVWLEVKRKPYGLQQSEREKYEYARDLAAFANSDAGGLLVIGLVADSEAAGTDTIRAVTPCKPEAFHEQTYANVAHAKITPSIDGLEISRVSLDEGDLLVLRVPPQPDYLQPFLVTGAMIEAGKVTGSFVSIPQRRGSDKRDMSPAAIHSPGGRSPRPEERSGDLEPTVSEFLRRASDVHCRSEVAAQVELLVAELPRGIQRQVMTVELASGRA